MTNNIILFLILFSVTVTGKAQQRINPKDSVDIKNQIEGFYTWYAGLIRDKELNIKFNPNFVKLKNGMTTLDFKNYREGLKKYGFANDFIERKLNDYKPCVDNLKSIPFGTLAGLELDDLESIKCAFSNTYEWGAGMDPIDGAELVGLNKLSDGKIEATIKFRSVDGDKEYMAGTSTFTLIKHKAHWLINDFK
ncbi:hypothetical protein SAMN04488109_5606 [Chryseolinea serpens]|uniref:DUF3828 domain-containing protein n=1 Tax=Chryseolinea serpens TaxID=947013 RepID=A0A1M5WDK5_9BACT|nr:hypothetical protein [Chryseolinea serpens]SHH85576.1 hypothetical protein SAMN04488109_5606 [Chryseolinea serpens]